MPEGVVFETDCTIQPPGPYGNVGKMGNIPGGEVFCERRMGMLIDGKEVSVPVKLETSGRLVCDACIGGVYRRIDEPVEVEFRNGFYSGLKSKDAELVKYLENIIKENREKFMPVNEEFGIGVNPAARLPPKISNMLENEKAEKTAHFAVGGLRLHTDFLFLNPTIEDAEHGITIMKKGVIL